MAWIRKQIELNDYFIEKWAPKYAKSKKTRHKNGKFKKTIIMTETILLYLFTVISFTFPLFLLL